MAASTDLVAVGSDTTQPTLATLPVSEPVHLVVIVVITALVGLLFLIVYFQLILVIFLRYKLVSYQTLLLFIILLWAALRLTLYSFYYFHCCELVNNLSAFPEWFLVSFPSVLQFFSLAIIVHYFGGSLIKVLERRQEMSSLVPPYRKMQKYKCLGWFMWLSAVFVFLAGNVTFSVLIHFQMPIPKDNYTYQLLITLRVVLLDGLFLIMGITLGICILLIYTTRVGKDVLETQRVYRATPFLIAIILIALFVSRAIYNAVALGVSDLKPFGWTVATDMGDYQFTHHYGYVIYLAGQFFWEVLPTFIIIVFFRIRASSSKMLTTVLATSPNSSQQKHFFDDPRRYDSENEDLLSSSFHRSSQMSIPNLPSRSHVSPSFANYGYGSTARHNYSAPSKYSINSAPHSAYIQPGTTPPKLFTQSPTFLSDRDH